MTVEIKQYVPNQDPESSIVATMDIFLPKMNLHLRRFKLIKSKHGMFVSPSAFKNEDEEWIKYIEFEGRAQKVLCDEIIEACEKIQPPPAEEPEPDMPPVMSQAAANANAALDGFPF